MTGPRDALHDALVDLESRAPYEPPPPLRANANPGGRVLAASGVAVAAVLAGVVIAAVMTRQPDGGQATPQPTPSATSAATLDASPSASSPPTPTATPTPAAATGFDVAWERFGWPDDVGISVVTYDEVRDQWVVAGGRTIWVSADGVSWSPAEVESAGCDSPEDRCGWAIAGIEPVGDQLIAMGLISSSGSDATALVCWLSDDGMTWSVSTPRLATTAQGARSAESNGRVILVTPNLTGDGGTAFNTSGDGISWQSSGSDDSVIIHDVYGDSDGFVGVGQLLDPSFADPPQPIVRVSTDGHAWETAAIGAASGDALSSIARLPSGRYVAAGIAMNGEVAAWASNGDDEPWTVTLLGTPRVVEGARTAQLTVAGGPRGIVLAWNTGDGLIVATTVDGDEWRVTEAPADNADLVLSAIGIREDLAVAFGGRRNPDNGFAPGPPFGGWLGTFAASTD